MKLHLRACLGFSLTMILAVGQCPRLWETTALSVYYRSKDSTPGCCSSDWLTQLQQSWCPLLRLLILGLVTLPIYNAVLILVGWRLHCTTKSNAERLLIGARPLKRPAPLPPALVPPNPSLSLLPPQPPPRARRRPAPTPPRCTPERVLYPSHLNPFGTSPRDQEQYQMLRRNLQLVLTGLQNPPLKGPSPRAPEPIMGPLEMPSEMATSCPSEFPKTEAKKKRSKVIFKRLWQRWRRRSNLKMSKKSLVSASSSSCSSTNGSSCFYVYLEET